MGNDQQELGRTVEPQFTYGDFLDTKKTAAERLTALDSVVGTRKRSEVNKTIKILRNPKEDLQVRISALYAISSEIGVSQDRIDIVLQLLGDKMQPAELRRVALLVMQEISFGGRAFLAKRAEYFDVLRTVVDDPDPELRQEAISVLALNKDEYAQRRLMEGLENPSRALVRPAKAIQLIGYDIHAEHYPILRGIVNSPPTQSAKKEAVRLLGSDPASKDMLSRILKDKNERRDIRTISAAALQSIAPAEFEDAAKQIVLDDDEDDQLRAVSISALSHFASPESLTVDGEFNRKVEQISQKSTSRQLKQATSKYMSNMGNKSLR
jgi:HEAT repeat protein